MDLQKEREAFEVLQNPKILQRAEFLVNISAYAVINEYRDNLFTLELVEELNFGWRMWKAAKAQAVPEGFVLVPKEPIQLFKEKLEDYLFDLWTGDHGCDWDGFLSADAVEHGVLWKMMLEAQEPSHD